MSTSTIRSRNHYTFKQVLAAIEGVIVTLACYLTLILKPLRSQWGMRKQEKDREFPGDTIISHPKSKFSHGINIDAPAEYVWPWVAQIGQSRGGFYSYELLENMAGLNIYNTEEILPEHQNPQVGDIIPFGSGLGYPLIICDPGKSMVIEVALDLDTNLTYDLNNEAPKNFLHITWLWYVQETGVINSRFISRNRVNTNDSFRNKILFEWLAEPMIFAMDRKMCLGIKKRAERYYKKSMQRES